MSCTTDSTGGPRRLSTGAADPVGRRDTFHGQVTKTAWLQRSGGPYLGTAPPPTAAARRAPVAALPKDVGDATVVLYLAVSLGIQRLLVQQRANRLLPDGGAAGPGAPGPGAFGSA
jgi:hypothetical protein